ncbi:MAG: MFS transporter [Anaerolineae bacterium]|nr:MFS transporter [Anaerolineae bacterium]
MSTLSAEQTQTILQQEKRNLFHLVADIAWFGLAIPSMGSFLSVYFINLGATALDMGLLSALPAIFMLLGTFLTNPWARRFPDSRQALILPTFVMRLRILLLAFIPFLPPEWRIPAALGMLALLALSNSVAGVVFLVLMQEAVTVRRFTQLLSQRQLALNIGIAISTLALGFWLERVAFPLNYQVMFVASFLFTLVSMWHAMQIRPLPEAETPAPPTEEVPARPVNAWREGSFRGIAGVLGFVFIGYFSILPVIPLRLVNDLGATEGFIALYSLLELCGAATMAYFAYRLVERFGHQAVIRACMTVTGLTALILALAPSLYFTLPAALINGAAWVGTDVSQFSFFRKVMGSANKTAYTNAYYQMLSLVSFVGPLIGSTLASWGLSLEVVLLVGAALRVIAGWAISFYHPADAAPDLQQAPAT